MESSRHTHSDSWREMNSLKKAAWPSVRFTLNAQQVAFVPYQKQRFLFTENTSKPV